MTEPDRERAAATISAVNMKLPPFWPADPEVWFAQVEAQFTTRGITVQKTKFEYLVASLSPEFATEVRDLILRPPTERPYDALKEQLIKRTTASEQRKLQQLLTTEDLGDRKPTQLLRRMQQLLGNQPELIGGSGAFLRELFLQRLPGNVRVVLAATDESLTIDKLAELADRIVAVATPSVSAVSTPQLTTEVDQLRAEVGRLQGVVKSLSSQSQLRRPSRFRRSPSPVRRRSPEPTDHTLCWYHQKFGDDARKCREPCTRGGLNDMASP